MASAPSSSSRSHGLEKGNWERCSISHSQLVELQKQGFLPPANLAPIRAELIPFNNGAQAENFPNPSKGERVCFVPYLLRGVGFPIHPFLRGLLKYYSLQLHSFTPASILHIAGYMSPSASYSWDVKPTSNYGGNYSASSFVTNTSRKRVKCEAQ